jgi:hypothetical protein
MNPGPTLANALWLAGGLAATRRFGSALEDPKAAQESWLRTQLVRHARSEWGRQHEFESIRDVATYVRRVPLTSYDDVQQQVRRIANGDKDILACGPVTHLAPTSGSTGARKLIPFTPELTAAFNAAVSPWMLGLVRQRPSLIGGPAYWSISPIAEPGFSDGAASSGVPIGFADDADYLGGPRAWLVRQAMAVASSIRFVEDTETFWGLTLLALLRHRELRLISIWHPSFLDLLTEAAEPAWQDLLDGVRTGGSPWESALPLAARASWRVRADPERATELARVGPNDWPSWWRELQVVSCWGEQAAEAGWRALVRRLPNALVQPKGLLATECVVTIPWRGERPLAVTSHFFEFLDEQGECRLAHQLERGSRYEVVVTNGGGLWRYRLGDVVECTGHVANTPSFRFVGRARTSDLRGEKLSEPFVADVLRQLWTADDRPSFATLRGRDRDGIAGYELLLPAGADSSVGQRLETALSANPHYALARKLGQLSAVSVVTGASDGLREYGGRIGDAKPRVLIIVNRDDPIDPFTTLTRFAP